MVERVDDYLPEVLAQDLEFSAAIFAEKKMTAGAPLLALSAEERARFRTSRMSLYSPYLAASARVQSLGPIEERESMVSFVDEPEHHLEERDSESSSTSSRYSSDGAEPPSFRHRGSVVTNATSLASVSCRPKNSPPPGSHYESSWIDGDSDGEEHNADNAEDCNVGSLSPRPPTPPSCELAYHPVTARALKIDIPSSWTHATKSSHRKSHSVSGGSPIVSLRKQKSGRSLDVSVRPSTMSGRKQQSTPPSFRDPAFSTVKTPPPRSFFIPQRTQSLQSRTSRPNMSSPQQPQMMFQPPLVTEPSPVSEGFPDSEEDSLYPATRRELAKPNPVFVRPPTPPEPLRSVQSWLNSSLQPYPWTSHSDEGARVVPLPPDAIETLRVSVACFPETMLLTSSLTVETIRSYAKKVRHPVTEIQSISGEASPPSPRKSLWRKVVNYKKAAQQLDFNMSPQRYAGSRQGSSIDSSSSAELDAPRPWTSLKNVFGHCSDYICDALYAHIVSYNYVSALVARNPVPLPGQSRTNSMSMKDSQQDDIPKKAASLLGLAVSADAAANMARFPRRLSSPLGDWNREGIMTSGNTAPSSQDNALRVIQSGLLQCIARLVATAKLMAESGTGEERMVDMEAEEADMLFMRSLCEIVRMAEEAS